MNLRSHAKAEIAAALLNREPVWALDTGNDGEDDILIGDYDEVVGDILAHFEMEALPDHWTLDPMGFADFDFGLKVELVAEEKDIHWVVVEIPGAG